MDVYFPTLGFPTFQLAFPLDIRGISLPPELGKEGWIYAQPYLRIRETVAPRLLFFGATNSSNACQGL